MKKVIASLLAFAMIAAAAMVPAPAKAAEPLGDATYTFQFGHGAAENSIGDLYCKKFEEIVEAKSGGSIQVDVYSGSQLGT